MSSRNLARAREVMRPTPSARLRSEEWPCDQVTGQGNPVSSNTTKGGTSVPCRQDKFIGLPPAEGN